MRKKNRFLLSSIPALIAAVVVTTAAAGPASGVGQSYPARPPIPQDLTFEGVVNGKLAAASTNCLLYKDMKGFRATLSGLVNGSPMEFTIYTISGYKGTGEYSIGGFENANLLMDFNHEQYTLATGDGPGKVTINADQKSGTVDADFVGSPSSEYVTGSWSCYEVTVS